MSSNWKKDLDDSLRIVRNAFLTGDIHTEFSFSSEQDDPDAKVKNTLKKKKLYVIVVILCLVLGKIAGVVGDAFLLLFHIPLYGMEAAWVRLIIGFIGAGALILVLYKWRKMGREAKAVYDENIMAKAVNEIFPEAILEPDGQIDSMDLYMHGVVPDFDDSQGSYLIRYEKDGKSCAFSNLTLTRREKDRNDRYYNKAIFVGQAYVLHYKARVEGYVRIMTTTQLMGREILDGYRKQDKGREQKIETENQIFNEQFDVYATNPHTAFYVVTPPVMERLLEMKERYGSFGVAVSGEEIAIALCSGYYLFEPPTSYQGIENISVEKSKDEIQKMLLFAQMIEDSVNGRVG